MPTVKRTPYTRVTGSLAALLVTMLLTLPVRAEERDADAAIRAGLDWLAANQLTDGPHAGAWEVGRPQYRPAMASFAGLAFLANGCHPGQDAYGAVVQRAMAYVMTTMDDEGYLGQGDPSGMYIHAVCTLFGLSYLGTSTDPAAEVELAQWCRRALEVIVNAQAVTRPAVAQGGWRYTPHTSESDLSVTSWQLLALHAARQCGYRIDPSCIDAALAYINRAYIEVKPHRQGESDSATEPLCGYMYRPGISNEPELSVTGVALFMKILLEEKTDPNLDKALAYLQSVESSWGGAQYGGYFYFALFYISQGMFQIGGDTWNDYRQTVSALLVEHQNGDGSWPFPVGNRTQSRLTGDAYPTALAILTLSLEKQFLPMYQRQKKLF